MNEFMALSLALFAGVLLGIFYFGLLWWTVQNGLTSQNPALLFLTSLMARTAIVLLGFYFVAQGHWSGLVAALIGFIMARVFVVRRLTRPPVEPVPSLEEEA